MILILQQEAMILSRLCKGSKVGVQRSATSRYAKAIHKRQRLVVSNYLIVMLNEVKNPSIERGDSSLTLSMTPGQTTPLSYLLRRPSIDVDGCEREQGHMAGAFDGDGQPALIFSRETSTSAR